MYLTAGDPVQGEWKRLAVESNLSPIVTPPSPRAPPRARSPSGEGAYIMDLCRRLVSSSFMGALYYYICYGIKGIKLVYSY